jgi:hypothetical protein
MTMGVKHGTKCNVPRLDSQELIIVSTNRSMEGV